LRIQIIERADIVYKHARPVEGKSKAVQSTMPHSYDLRPRTTSSSSSSAKTDPGTSSLLSVLADAPRFQVVYEKMDGSRRSACGKILPEHRDQPGDQICYFDLGIMAVRSFRVDRVKSVRVC